MPTDLPPLRPGRAPAPKLDPRWQTRHVRIYIDPHDWWIGYYRGDRHHYVCVLPTVVIRWRRR